MNHIITIVKKELQSYFHSPAAYVLISFFLLVSSWLFMRNFFIANISSMREYFALLPWIFLFLIPAISMRLWSEEKKMGTNELLLTWPVRDYEAVVGKFLGSFIFILICLTFTAVIPIAISYAGDPDLGLIIASYVGAAFLAAGYLAIGLFASSMTDNQIIAFIIALAISFALLIIGQNFVLLVVPQIVGNVFRFLSLSSHYESILRGVFDSRDILYYLSIVFVFLLLNVRNIEKRF
ncbi:MAG: ABC transporter permease subunit [Parcubacteria group bacterium]|nr:ABC transporter permease subunit [Parcubacteria group bacterium]